MRTLAGFFVGVLVAGGLAVSVVIVGDPCAWRCGDGTECSASTHRCVVAIHPAVATAPTPSTKRVRHRAANADPLAPEAHLKPGDEKPQTLGDSLGRTEKIDFAAPDAHELSQDELDTTFHRASPAIEKCITDALGDLPLATGRVDIGLRVDASGDVSKVRVEAPTVLQRAGLYRCVRTAVLALHFAASGGGSVVNYPFELK